MVTQSIKFYELSHPEKRLFYLQKYYPGTSMWNVPQSVLFKERINVATLKKAAGLFIRNNQNMRIRFVETDAGPRQFIAPFEQADADIPVVEFGGPDAVEKMHEWADAESRRPFADFPACAMYRLYIIDLGDSRGGFYLNGHHMVVDGYSLAFATDKICEYYRRLSAGETSIEENFKLYFDYLGEESAYLASKEFEADRDFWFARYATDIENLELRPASAADDFRIDRAYCRAPEGLSARIYDYCEKNRISVYRLFMCTLYAYLFRLTMKEDIVIQAAHHGRPDDFLKTTGMFVSTVPVRLNFAADSSFRQLYEKFSPEFKQMLSRHRFPVDLLGSELRRLGRDPGGLFNVMLSQFVKCQDPGLETRVYGNGESVSLLSYYLSYEAARRDEIEFFLDYRVSAFSRSEIELMAGHIYSMLEQVISDPDKKIYRYDFLSDNEKRRLIHELNDTAAYFPPDQTFCDLFDEQLALVPDNRAVVYLNKSMTYAELGAKSAALARRLRSMGVGRDDIIGIFADRSLEMFAGVIGIVRSGAAYMPIDTKYPPDRIEFMLADSRSKVLLTQKHLIGRVKFDGAVIDLDDPAVYEDAEAGEKLVNINKPEDLAYVIYTSGSTGRPKGTLIEHRALLNFSCWYKNEHNITSADRLSKHASFGFDVSISETFPPLLAGAEVHIISEEIKMSLGELNDYFEKNGITIGFFTTQLAEQFNENIDNRSLRLLYAAGEKLRTFTPRNYRLYNGYGPTECTVYTTFFPVDKNYANIPIGRPLANTRLYVVDRFGNLMPEGCAGELLVGGVCLARGYLNRPEITAEKFIASPLEGCGRVYKTGDLVRWLPDGNMEYFGRIDSQVKIRGFRIELGEIETEIMKCAGVNNAAVTVVTEGGGKFLCAYLTGDASVCADAVKAEISKNLPEFMIPAHFVLLAEMPLNASGKIDRKSLPAPRVAAVPAAASDFVAPSGEFETRLAELWKEILSLDAAGAGDNFFKIGGHSLKAVVLQARMEKEFGHRMPIRKIFDNPVLRDMAACLQSALASVPAAGADRPQDAAASQARPAKKEGAPAGRPAAKPSDAVEEKLLAIWKEVLGAVGIGVEDDFNEAGGHSLKMMSMQYRIEREFGLRLPMKKLFESTTVRLMAGAVRAAAAAAGAAPAGPADSAAEAAVSAEAVRRPVSSVQKRLYIVEGMEGPSNAYNIPYAIRITGNLDRLRFSEAVDAMIERHDSLRTSFEAAGGEPVQVVHGSVRLKKIFQEAPGGLTDEMIAELIKPFDLGRAPLLRVKLFKTGPDEHIFFVNFHHIIFDGMSLEIFMRELFEIYEGRGPLEPAPQYGEFCEWQKRFLASPAVAEQENAWLEMFAGDLPTLNMPADFKRPPKPESAAGHFEFMAEPELAARIKSLAASTGNTIYTVVLAALNALLARYSSQEDIIVGTPLLGRPTLDSQKMIGMFVNTMPVRSRPAPDKKFADFLNEVRSSFLTVIDNQDYQLDALIEKLGVKRAGGHNPLFDVVFVYQTSQGMKDMAYGELMVRPAEVHSGAAKFDLTLQAFEGEESLRFDLEYRKCLFREDTARRMAAHLINILDEVSRDAGLALKDIELMSPAERKTVLYDFNATAMDYPKDKTFVDIFDEQAERTPDKKAVVYLGKSMTYRELKTKSEIVASKLRELGVSRDDIVGIMVDRSLEMFVGAVGVLKSGAAFMPIDTKYPADRIEFMLADSKSKALVTQKHLLGGAKYDGPALALDDEALYTGAPAAAAPFKNISRPNDLAYVIYTSGSTGQPKGALIEHHSLLNFSFWYKASHAITEADALAKHASFGFDASIMEVFPPLIAGAEVHIISEDIKLSLNELNDYFEKNRIRGAFFTTQLAEQYNENFDSKTLRYIDAGGEKLRTFTKRSYTLNNGYGPTECTVYTTFFPVDRNYDNIPIGKPLANTRLYVLDRHGKLLPAGIPGELCVAGECVGRGYLGRPELTAEKFPADPFYPGEKMYRTGDLVRWLPDGNIEYLGRIDFQVKLRGFRIELGEIEVAMQKHEDIEKAVVIAKDDEHGNKYLCAFYTSKRDITEQQLREYLAGFLANYMIPSQMIRLDEMPVNASGKIDRKAVAAIEVESRPAAERIMPSSEREEKIARAWRDVLGLKEVGVNENFFDIGGHSLKAVTLAAKLQQDYEVTVNDIFKYQTIGALAKNISEKKGTLYSRLEGLKTDVPEAEERLQKFISSPEALAQKAAYDARSAELDAVDIQERENYAAVMLTGATGYLGIYMLHDLIKGWKCDIYLPVRGKTPGDALRRVNEKYRYYFGAELRPNELARVKILCADLEKERLGLDEATYAEACEKVDAVIHSAANVKHYGRYEDFYGPNVKAVENLLEFAATGRKKDFNHISTISVIMGSIEGRDCALFTEDCLDMGQKSDNLYVATKLEAEKIVVTAREKLGLKTSIFRVGNIAFNSKTGLLQQNVEENAFSVTVKSFVNLGVVPETADENELSFVDATSASVLELFDRKNFHDMTFHCQNHIRVKLSELLTSPGLGLNVEKLPFNAFIDRLKTEYGVECRRPHVENILLHRGWLENESGSTEAVVFTTRTARLLKRLGFEWPRVDETKMVEFMAMALRERIDFIKGLGLFEGAPVSVLREVAFMSKEAVFPEGADVVWEGDAVSGMHLIISGNAELQKVSRAGWTGTIMIAGRGDILGGEALSGRRANVTAEAIMGDLRTLVIDCGRMRQTLMNAPELCFNFMKARGEAIEKLEGIVTNID